MARITLEGLEKRFEANLVVPALDLVVEDGEFFSFVGPSGCGKSTLLHLIAGIESPSAGTIRFDDERVDGLAPGARNVAMVFQSYALYPHLSVRENIAFPLRVRKAPKAEIERELARVAQMLGLAPLLERKPRQLSGGQRQRVALARALVRRPRVFLMDEPLSNLDAQLRLSTREEIKALHARTGVTTIYVTHDQEEAMALSSRMAVLREGRVQQCAAPQDVYDAPANRFVAGFVGSPPMVLLEAEALAALQQPGPHNALVGLRPADVAVHAGPQPGALEARVLLTEPTGSALWVVGEWRGQRIKGHAVPGARFPAGAAAWFVPARIHLFDRRSGERIGG